MLRIIRAFWHDQRGIALILVSVMLPVIIGFALLTIDMSRASNLHNDLQKGADSFAIAGAAELDGNPDAIIRSDRAIANLVDNTYRFSNAGPQQTLTDAGITRRYLRSLPPNDTDAIRVQDVITDEVGDAGEAEFVEVTVNPTGFSAIFPASFLTGSTADNSFNVGATSVAGFAGVVVCDMTPLFICNPFPGQNLQDVANNQNFYRKGIKLVMGSTSWGPGNMGFLRPLSAHGYGEGDLADDIAHVDFPECVNSRGIYTQTGNLTEKAKAAFNTRFDMYGPHFAKTDASVPPAPNIRKGFDFAPKGNKPGTDPCDKIPGTDLTKFHSLTQDTAYPLFDGRIGNGLWDYEGYVATNYPNGELDDFDHEDGSAYTNANPPSRYDLYKYEIDNDLVDTLSVGQETGEPLCHASPSTDPDRRLIYAAIVDCDLYEDQLNGQSGSMTAMGFASFFLTEPVTGDDVLAEIVDIDGNQGRGTMVGFAKDNVQLYR
ncbi:pilus assembly protein TadG-related protein [Mesorhizobium mediterraneum]|uniref:pilus assembly protein TadG-related protein n=1 Tax=Mesorhizobium mediterraneum TaxID=43617 RepID=UPI001783C9DD|nr:pilus assembly protein TadG-related protein [Mesorhizobium mediterraneum]